MKRARLANGLDVTAIGLGSAPLGGLFTPVSDADAEATLAQAWAAEGWRARIDYLGRHASAKNRSAMMVSPRFRSSFKLRAKTYFAAVTMISTVYWAAANLASTVARAGVLPGETQASHTAFISPKVFMSVM